jgi:hypothetical protein
VLESVTPSAKAHGDLGQVRGQLKKFGDALATLRAAPEPSADIETRLKQYVAGLGRPTITGIGNDEQLRVTWPGGGWDQNGPRVHRAELLPLFAFLHPDELVSALLQEIERKANEPLPRARRLKRIAELEAELEELAYAEEALVCAAIANGETVERRGDAPAPVVLLVRVGGRRWNVKRQARVERRTTQEARVARVN